jgi:hypothetical protein
MYNTKLVYFFNHPYLSKQKERNAYKKGCGNKYTKIY